MTLSTADPAAFPRDLDVLLKDPSESIAVSSRQLLDGITPKQTEELIKRELPHKPGVLDAIGSMICSAAPSAGRDTRDPSFTIDILPPNTFDILPSSTLALLKVVIGHNAALWKHEKKKITLLTLLASFQLRRSVVSLTPQERGLLRAMAALYANRRTSRSDVDRFLASLVWNDGKCSFMLPPRLATDPLVGTAHTLLKSVVSGMLPPHDVFLLDTTHRLAQHRTDPTPLGQAITASLSEGARWLQPQDLASSRVFDPTSNPAALIIGYHPVDGSPVRYSGDASLITIAAPGTGKTQAQVIPNLLTYPGSVFVLDVKGELWQQTSAHRARTFGPVFRFSPTSSDGCSHCYNPFDMIPREPIQAANGCEVFASQLVPDNPHAKDPYWDRRARDFLWAFAMLVALDNPPEERNLLALTSMLSVTTNFEDNADAIPRSPTDLLIKRLEALADRTNLLELRNIAVAFRDGLYGTRLGSVFDTARMHLNALARTPSAAAATSRTDWVPLQLRHQPGTSVYLTFKPGEMRAFAGIIRLIFQQHADALTRDYVRREGLPPITFFLDEMPQLGNLQSLNDLLDVGRGAGVRLWMFAQYLGQLREAYDRRADGIVGATQIRCFMQPDNEAAKFIEPLLGTTRNLATGKEEPLAYAHQLSSRVYGDHTIALPRNEHPALLRNRMAFETMSELMNGPAPLVPRVPLAPKRAA